MKGRFKKLLTYSSLGLITALSSQVYASGYKMEFQSASVLADAGEAAVVEDATTNWYNSAGLPSLPQQAVFTGFDVYAPVTYDGVSIAPAFGSTFVGVGSASSHPNALIPSFHYSLPFKQKWAFGLSVAPAWGFAEDYGSGSIARYNLIRISTRTFDIAPSIAYQITDQWSIGLGPDLHYFSVLSRTAARTEGFPFFTASDSLSRFSASSWNWGAHVGLLFRPNNTTRVGLNYRTKIAQQLKGGSEFWLNGFTGFSNNLFELGVPLPPVTTLSFYHDISNVWAVMGTVSYDQWSSLKRYHGENYQSIPGSPGTIGATGIVPNVFIIQDMRDTVDLSIGAHYTVNDQTMLRASLKYLPTPVNDKYRNLNFPDGRKIGLNVGGHYQWNKKIGFDVMYGHVWVKTVQINDLNPVTFATSTGHSKASLDVFGAQLVWTI
jgi:long-chain fatty acid transport protein